MNTSGQLQNKCWLEILGSLLSALENSSLDFFFLSAAFL